MTITELLLSLFAVVLAAACSACLTWALRPMLLRYALARPNARSSHRVPTPQGAGIAVTVATLMVAGGIMACAGSMDLNIPTVVFGATLFISLVGVGDDIKSIPVLPRLLLQAVAVAAVTSFCARSPDIQERLLFLAAAEKGRDTISEKKIRALAAEYDWERQRRAFERLLVR